MAGSVPRPRKRRTRTHVIAAQSVNHLERFIIDEGHTAQRIEQDYGYDVIMYTYDAEGFLEEGSVYFQLKASENLRETPKGYVFDLDIRDYNLWKNEPMPVILNLFDAARRRAVWLYLQQYFAQNEARRPKQRARTIRVRVPKRHVVSRRAVAKMRLFKERVLRQIMGVVIHA